MRGYPRPCTGPRPIVAGFRSKGQDRSQDRTGLDLRSGSQEKSCGVGLRGFESHPPHHWKWSGQETGPLWKRGGAFEFFKHFFFTKKKLGGGFERRPRQEPNTVVFCSAPSHYLSLALF